MKRSSPSRRAPFAGARVLVTGAGGFIGGRLTARLLAAGARVHAVVRRRGSAPAGAREVLADVTDAARVCRLVRAIGPAFVFHLAAWRDRSAGLEAAAEAFRVNAGGTLTLLDAAARLKGMKGFVAMGAGDEYGDAPAPWNEKARERPSGAYGLSKLTATRLCEAFHLRRGLPVAVLRPTVVYGPGQAGDMFIPSMIRALLSGRDFQMTAGRQTRDFLYIDDLIEAMLRAAMRPAARGQVINVGSGLAVPVFQVARTVRRMAGRGRLRLGALAYRPSEPMAYAVTTARARRILGWRARVDLEEGLRWTVESLRPAPP